MFPSPTALPIAANINPEDENLSPLLCSFTLLITPQLDACDEKFIDLMGSITSFLKIYLFAHCVLA